MGYEDPVVSQEIFDHIDIGKELENKFSQLNYTQYPLSTEKLGVLAIYGTNESWFKPEPTEKLHGGIVVGIGAGAIFSLVNLYNKDDRPEAILSCDTEPEVILAGRILVQGLLDSNTEEEMNKKMGDDNKVKEYYQKVLGEETNTEIRKLFEARIENLFSAFRKPYKGINPTVFDYCTDINLPKIFKENWGYYKDLAHAGNMGFVLSNINNLNLINYAKEEQSKIGGDTLIYLTNAIDHITERGYNLMKDPRLIQDPWAKVKTLEGPKTHFIDTLGYSLKYVLRYGNHAPEYTFDDFPIKPWSK